MRVLLIFSAVNAIGSGATGGVSDLLMNTVTALHNHGHRVDILAGEGSSYQGPGRLIPIAGRYQPTIVTPDNHVYPILPDALIANYIHYAYAHRAEYDVILNMCHDWLPYYVTPFFDVPLLHLPNVCDEHAVVTEQIQKIAHTFAHRVAVLSHAQAVALGIEKEAFYTGFGIDPQRYPFSQTPPTGTLIWCARVSAEKGLEDAAAIAKQSGKRLRVCGFMQDEPYFQSIKARYPEVIEYAGFLDKQQLMAEMGKAEALLCTHRWVEALGIVVIEAQACGTPVITYHRGGPAELIEHGTTGFVVATDTVEEATRYVSRLAEIRREICRQRCEERYNLEAYGTHLEAWLKLAGRCA